MSCRALLSLTALAVAGCAPLGEAQQPRQAKQPPAPHEQPSPAPPQHVATAAPAPAAAIRAFATTYVNWNADNVSQRMQTLADQSVGQARSALELAAAQTAQDYELRSGGISNSGTVEAIAPLQGRRNEYVVVTLEQTSATNTTAYQGLKPAWHLALATVIEITSGRWAVSEWQPES